MLAHFVFEEKTSKYSSQATHSQIGDNSSGDNYQKSTNDIYMVIICVLKIHQLHLFFTFDNDVFVVTHNLGQQTTYLCRKAS